MENHRSSSAGWGLEPSEVAALFRDEGLSRGVLDNYYLYHLESPANMIADLDSYRENGRPLDVVAEEPED